MARTDPQVNLRIPSDLKARIDASAEANNRSMNAEVVARLQQSFDAAPATLSEGHRGVQSFADENDMAYEQALDLLVLRGCAPHAPAAYLIELHPGMSMSEVQRAIREISKHAPSAASISIGASRAKRSDASGGKSSK